MPSYDFRFTRPDGSESGVSLQTSDADAATTVFKEQYPDCTITEIKVGPDMAVMTKCDGSRSVMIQTPFVHLNVPVSWNLPELTALVQYFRAHDIKDEEDCECNQLVAVFSSDLNLLMIKAMLAVAQKLQAQIQAQTQAKRDSNETP